MEPYSGEIWYLTFMYFQHLYVSMKDTLLVSNLHMCMCGSVQLIELCMCLCMHVYMCMYLCVCLFIHWFDFSCTCLVCVLVPLHALVCTCVFWAKDNTKQHIELTNSMLLYKLINVILYFLKMLSTYYIYCI